MHSAAYAVCFASVLLAGLALIGGWWLMIAVGAIHHEWALGMPTIGYWSAVKIVAIGTVGIAIGRTRAHLKR